MSRRRVVAERVFTCPICGTVITAYKNQSHNSAKGHIKTMWCYKCKAIRDFIQLPNYMTR